MSTMIRIALAAACLLMSACAPTLHRYERAMERACGDRGANDAWPDAQGRIHVTCD
jgi:hypothetical protein